MYILLIFIFIVLFVVVLIRSLLRSLISPFMPKNNDKRSRYQHSAQAEEEIEDKVFSDDVGEYVSYEEIKED